MTNLGTFLNTALLALGSALLSGALGYAMAPWLQSRRKSQRLIRTLWLLPFVLPAFLVGMLLLPIQQGLNSNSNFGIYWILLAHVLMNAGYIASLAVANAPSKAVVESAQLAGASTRQIRRHIEIPYLLPALAPGLLLVALYSATSFGLVNTLGLGYETLETKIASAALRDLDLNLAGTLAALQTLLTLLMFLLARKLAKRSGIEIGHDLPGRIQTSTVSSLLAISYSATLILLLTNVFTKAASGPGLITNLSNLSGLGTRDLLNISVLQAAGNSVRNMLVSVFIATIVAWSLTKSRKLNFLALLPIGISPVVWGLGALIAIGYLPRFISSSWMALPTLQSLFLIPLIYQLVHPARKMFAQDLSDAAKVDGASSWQIARYLEMPILWPTIRVALSLASLSALGEFGAASFLAFGDQATLPLVLFRLISRPGQENFALAMTSASLFILISAYVLWIANRGIQTQRRVSPTWF